MKVHYFYERKSGAGFYDIELCAIKEYDVYSQINNRKEKSFTYVEKLKVFISNNMKRYHDATFKIEFGKDSCFGIGEDSLEGLYNRMTNSTFHHATLITRKQYERIRKLCFAIYEKEKQMDFDLVEQAEQGNITVLAW